MKNAILAVGAVIAIALIFGSRDFGALPSKADKKRYGKRSKNHNGKRFTYPDEWTEIGLSDDVRTSEKRELNVVTPHICETVCIDDELHTEYWWRDYT